MIRQAVQTRNDAGLLLFGIMLVAASLRAPFVGVAPVLGMIQHNTGISATSAGILTTLPLIAFAAVSPVAALLARRFGIEKSVFTALVLIAAGTFLRSAGPVWALFLGTAVLGGGIAVANVLLPSLLKRDFPLRVTGLTGAYVLVAGTVSAIASALVIPLAHLANSNWQIALASMAALPLLAIAAWLPQMRPEAQAAQLAAGALPGASVWRSPLAWQVTAFLGLGSSVYYVIVSWVPSILVSSGYPPETAGVLHGVCQFASGLPGLFIGPAIRRVRDQRILAVGVALATGAGVLGLWLFPVFATAWVALAGFGAGAVFVLGLAFISLRTAHSLQAAALSGMAQCLGYTLAAAGPPLAGLAHDITGGWGLVLGACFIASMLMIFFGTLAGRARTV